MKCNIKKKEFKMSILVQMKTQKPPNRHGASKPGLLGVVLQNLLKVARVSERIITLLAKWLN